MKTAAGMDPLHSALGRDTLSGFLKQQDRLRALLEHIKKQYRPK